MANEMTGQSQSQSQSQAQAQAQAQPQTVNALDPLGFPLRGSRLIEASAGTGKTFTIALLYVRAILGHGDIAAVGRGLTPRDILVVTFTEAATKELRDRIRKRLAEAAEVFRATPEQARLEEQDKGDDPLIQLRASYQDPVHWPAKARLLQLAAESMDEAAVHTIHGWCNRMLKEHAFDSGGLFNQNLETDQSELFTQVVRDYWRTFVTPLGADAAEAWLGYFASPEHLQRATGRLMKHLANLPSDCGTPAEQLGAVAARRREVFDDIRPRIAEAARDFLAVFQQAKAAKQVNGTKLNEKNLTNWLGKLMEWSEASDLSPPDLSEAAWGRLSPAGIQEAWKAGTPPDDHALVRAVAQLLEASTASVPEEHLLGHACHWLHQRLEREKQRRAEMGFDDLLTRLDSALQGEGGDHLAAMVRHQFPLAMIDEFQDTDPVQYRIFDRVYRIRDNDPEIGLFMIGDPKQAIYAFRGADIFTYLKAREATAGRHETLPRNFRSAHAMVEASNQVFHYGEQEAPRGAFLFRQPAPDPANPIPFHPVGAHGRKETFEIQGTPPPAMTFWTLANEHNKDDVLAQVAAACASEVVSLLNLGVAGDAGFRAGQGSLQPVKSSDVAILVNTGNEARHIRQALAERGVRSVYLSDQASVLDTQQARDVLHWLEACAEPERDTLVRTALATQTLDLTWQRLDHLRRNELAWEEEIEAFRQFHGAWSQQGVLAMLRRLLARFEVPARLLAQDGGERVLTDVLHIAELLQRESQQVDGEQALIRRLSDMITDARGHLEALQVRLESDAELVQVVTVHKSKGLEYPLVFLPYATSCRPVGKKDVPVQWHEVDGTAKLTFTPDDDQLARADMERLGEDIRKLYVALTRARHCTWVGAPDIKGNERRSALGYLAGLDHGGASLHECLQALVAGVADNGTMWVAGLPVATDTPFQPPAPPRLGAAREPLRRAREHWWIASYSSLQFSASHARPVVGQPVAEPETAEAERQREESAIDGERAGVVMPSLIRQPAPDTDRIHGFHRGAGPGTFLHNLLEWCARIGFDAALRDEETVREVLVKRCATRGWDAWAEPLHHWLKALLTTPFSLPPQPDGSTPAISLAGLGASSGRLAVVPELEFWFSSRDVDAASLDRIVREHTLKGVAESHKANRPGAESIHLNGMLKGFIDLVFEHEGRYYVVDYKSNVLGANDQHYTPEAMAGAIAEKRYDLQYALYLLALHRLLKSRLQDYDYDRHVGGAAYLFIRGHGAASAGVIGDRPDRAMIEAMDELFRTGQYQPGRGRNDGVMEQGVLL